MTHKQVGDQNLVPRLADFHALNHSCFLPSKTQASHSTNSGKAHKKLQGVFGAGETAVNVMSLRALAADQLMGERQTLKALSLPRVMRARQKTRGGLYNKESLPSPRHQESSPGPTRCFPGCTKILVRRGQTDIEQSHKSFLLLKMMGATKAPGTAVTQSRQEDTHPVICPQRPFKLEATAEVTYLAGKPGSWHDPHLLLPAPDPCKTSPDLLATRRWPGLLAQGPAAIPASPPSRSSQNYRFCHWNDQDNFA